MRLYLVGPISFVAFGLAYCLFLIFFIEPMLEHREAAQQKVHNSQAQECRSHGGVPIMSNWDGRLTDCQGAKSVTKQQENGR